MTTIVWHQEGILATDRMAVSDGIASKCQKLFTLDHYAIAVSGTLSCGPAFVRWFNHLTGDCPLDDDTIVYVMDLNTGQCDEFDSNGVGISLNPPFASSGTGSGIALGVLEMGGTPQQAIEIASKYDVNTGLGVDLIKI